VSANQYITQEQFDQVLKDLDAAYSETQKQELLDRATGDLEADLAEKFLVPLAPLTGGTYLMMTKNLNQKFACNKVLNAIRAKIKEIIGYDKNRVLTGTIDSTEKFINVHGIEYKAQIKTLLNPMIVYGFKLQPQAEDAQTPVQHLGLAKANNKIDPFDDTDGGGGVLY
jgi:hypothetical protein